MAQKKLQAKTTARSPAPKTKIPVQAKSKSTKVGSTKRPAPKAAVAKAAVKAGAKARPAAKPVPASKKAEVVQRAAAPKNNASPPNGKKPVEKAVATAKVAVTKPAPTAAVGQPKVALAQPKAVVAQPKAPAKITITAPAPVAPAAINGGKARPHAAAPIARPVAPIPGMTVPPGQPIQRAMPAAIAKPVAPRLTAPMAPAHVLAARAAQRAPAEAIDAAKKPVSSRHGFKTSEFIVYPAHGVGRIVGIEEQEIAGISLELFVIQFEKDKMTLRVPTSKLASVGMRKLAEDGIVRRAMDTLKGKARIKRTMWSRRAQEYEAKINSGDLVSIAEVVRDLYRSEAQPEQSYSERQLYEAALDRMAREIAAVEKLDERGAIQRITEVLSKSARGRRAAEEEAAVVAAADSKAA
jgi:CarD family transcriptional regulator